MQVARFFTGGQMFSPVVQEHSASRFAGLTVSLQGYMGDRSVFMDPCDILIVPCLHPPAFSLLLASRSKRGGTQSSSGSSPSSQ